MFNSYGLTRDDYNKIYASQNEACAICLIRFDQLLVGLRTSRPFIDHLHIVDTVSFAKLSSGDKRKFVRGLVCGNCNFLIGSAKENVKIIQSAISYLQKWSHLKDLPIPILPLDAASNSD